MNNKTITIAVLDMYDGVPNQGMRCIIDIIGLTLLCLQIFDVRGKSELPEIDKYDIYISQEAQEIH
jgi:hypothetical protein